MVRGAKYELTIINPGAVEDVDVDGFPVADNAASVVVRGSFQALNMREVERAGRFGVHAEAVAHLPHGTDVRHTSTVRLDADADGYPAVPDQLSGEWLVSFVQHTQPFLRVLCRRPESA